MALLLLKYFKNQIPTKTYIKNFSSILNNLKLQKPIAATSCFKYYTTSNENNTVNIYEGGLSTKIKTVKLISLSTSLLGIVAQPILYKEASVLGGPIMISLMGFIGFFTFVTPFLLHRITRNYVTVLEYNPEKDEYYATIYNFFLRKKLIPFKIDDVLVPDIPGMFTSFLVKGKPLFVEPTQFSQTMHYGRIMGYDKPIDFRLDKNSKDEFNSKQA